VPSEGSAGSNSNVGHSAAKIDCVSSAQTLIPSSIEIQTIAFLRDSNRDSYWFRRKSIDLNTRAKGNRQIASEIERKEKTENGMRLSLEKIWSENAESAAHERGCWLNSKRLGRIRRKKIYFEFERCTFRGKLAPRLIPRATPARILDFPRSCILFSSGEM